MTAPRFLITERHEQTLEAIASGKLTAKAKVD